MITWTCMTRFFYSCFPFLIRIVGSCNNTERRQHPPPIDKWKKYGHKYIVDWLISKWIHLLVFVMLFNSIGELTTQFCSWSHFESQHTIYHSWPLWEYAQVCFFFWGSQTCVFSAKTTNWTFETSKCIKMHLYILFKYGPWQ